MAFKIKENTTCNWQIGKSLTDCLLELYHSELWADVKFLCKDQDRKDLGDRVLAHKMVLATRSPVFQAMFYGPCASTEEDIYIEDIDSESLVLFFRYLYSDATELNDTSAISLMQIAHKYQVLGLFKYCTDYLKKVVNVKNACSFLEIALFYEAQDFLERVICFIDDNVEQVIESAGFLEISQPTLLHMLRGDTFFAEESKIFYATVEWALHKSGKTVEKGSEIREILGHDVFYNIRVPSMDFDKFYECTYTKGYYCLDEYEKILGFVSKFSNEISLACHSTVSRRPRIQITEINKADQNLLGTTLQKIKKEPTLISKLALNVSVPVAIHGFKCTKMIYGSRNPFKLAFKGSFKLTHGEDTVEERMFETELANNDDEFVMFDKPINVKIWDSPVDITIYMCCVENCTVKCVDSWLDTVRYSDRSLEFEELPGIKLSYNNETAKSAVCLLEKVMFEYISNRPNLNY